MEALRWGPKKSKFSVHITETLGSHFLCGRLLFLRSQIELQQRNTDDEAPRKSRSLIGKEHPIPHEPTMQHGSYTETLTVSLEEGALITKFPKIMKQPPSKKAAFNS